MDFRPRAFIDHSALRHNLQRVRETAPESRVWAVIKADAYGHGVQRVAKALDQADGFAVARMDEALDLRKSGVGKPVMVLEGALSAEEARLAGNLRLDLVVHQPDQIELLEKGVLKNPVRVWIKIDTGMHRLGIPAKEVAAVWDRLTSSPNISGSPCLMTHLANADDRNDGLTDRQCRRLMDIPESTGALLSIGNSGGILGWRGARSAWVRPGIMLYGASPFTDSQGTDEGLRPVMTLCSRLIAVNRLKRGDALGYGGIYRCPENMPVGVIGIGYGDGYPRHAGEGTPVLLNGRRVPLVGRVSMDTITVDLRTQPDARVGDPVVLWGEGLAVEEIASSAGTISYELFCKVTGRVRFIDRSE